MDAETRRIQAIGEAKAKLVEAVSKLNQQGGALLGDKENLSKLLQGVGSLEQQPQDNENE